MSKVKITEIPEGVVAYCGCMATRHPLAASCIECGRIVCDKEISSSFICPFCKANILPPLSYEDVSNSGFDQSTIKAYKLKDKLLQFDKENAKRTQVHDAQADYYENSTWLSEEEKIAIDNKELERKGIVDAINKSTSSMSLNLGSGNFHLESIASEVIDSVLKDENETANTIKSSSTSTNNRSSSSSSYQLHHNQSLNQTLSCVAASSSSSIDVQNSDGTLRPLVDLTNKSMAQNKGKVGDIYRELHSLIALPKSTNGKIHARKGTDKSISQTQKIRAKRVQHNDNGSDLKEF